MATTFENIVKNSQRKGITDTTSKDALEWFRKNVRKTTRTVNPSRLIREQSADLVNSWTNMGMGKLYSYFYQPKYKDELPFYDAFPLMIPFSRTSKSITGLNLHYLPPILRAKLLDALYDTLNNDRWDETTKMKFTYKTLVGASKFGPYKPCIKMYLGDHFRSRIIRYQPDQWNMAVMLPSEQFQKASNAMVWSNSRSII